MTSDFFCEIDNYSLDGCEKILPVVVVASPLCNA